MTPARPMERRFVTHCLVISVTGCDTTSYPYKVGKVKPLKKMITQGKSNLLAPLEKQRLSKQDAEKILSFSFMQTIMYPEKQDEDFMETRICMYEQQKNKSSLTLLSDKHSAEAHVKRSNLQAYIWKQCVLKDINPLLPDGGASGAPPPSVTQ